MRSHRTAEEIEAISRMKSALASTGNDVRDDDSVQDRPDWVFQLNGERVGAECTCINLQQLMKWSRQTSRYQLGKYYEVRFGNEPHLWVKKAIESKNPSVSTYKLRAKAESIWLLLHTEFTAFAFFACAEPMLTLMRAAASAIQSDFEAVWLVHAESGPQCLWKSGDPRCAFPELAVTDSYPTLRVRQGIAKLTAEGGEFSLGLHNAAETLVIQPLDTRYTI